MLIDLIVGNVADDNQVERFVGAALVGAFSSQPLFSPCDGVDTLVIDDASVHDAEALGNGSGNLRNL